MMAHPIRTERNDHSASENLVPIQERTGGRQRNYVCSDDESDEDSDDDSDDESEIFENMNEMSCQYESEDSEQLECRVQQ